MRHTLHVSPPFCIELKEEQLKLKEVAINDTMTEKTRILDRMYKAEARNLEMEHTVKNFQNRIEMLESRKTLQGDGGVLTVRAWPLIICWYTCLMLVVIFLSLFI
jgi:uncharacterized coiled-coil protein SlyX